ncbi:hypothetical protein [Nonomuraea jiangxiensis]|uniref:DUF4352 domain-containing protein n=1 Tax=Nonomuraea jiangxiensis TaxID=633440 RepID=A0A1G8LBY6_9ACTN|nr:hypothetical protein [Nonomuraea jiangxiensis]SDI52947.1 hypothetical protein SAMN05421869_10647 [Nonomuraea jiangxiensis]
MTATEPRSATAPPRRTRRAARRPGAGARLLGVVAGLVLLGAAVGVQSMDMAEGELSDPITYTGAKGENVDAQRFTVRLDSFSAARSVQTSTATLGTDNLFLIVNASAKSSRKPYHLGQPVLVTADGKRFDATDRIDRSLTLANTWVQPDIWVSGRFFFEVPASVLAGAGVVFGLPPAAGPVEPYQPEVEVDLGLDEEGARKLAASPQDVFSTVRK